MVSKSGLSERWPNRRSSTELSLAPEFREISRIREFSENSTEFRCYFQNWSKTPQKASKCYQNVEKAPEIAQNFYKFVKSTPKSSRKAPEFLKNITELFRFCQKYPKKLPKSSRILERFQSGDSSGVAREVAYFSGPQEPWHRPGAGRSSQVPRCYCQIGRPLWSQVMTNCTASPTRGSSNNLG